MHIQTCFVLFSKVARLSNYKYDTVKFEFLIKNV